MPKKKKEAGPTPVPQPTKEETAALIAAELGETEEAPRAQILTIVETLGRTQSRRLLRRTQEVEASGGMMVLDGSRRRTPGGVYFHLAYTKGIPKPGMVLRRPRPGESPQAFAERQQSVPVFTWADRLAVIKEAEEEKGQASVKITLVGRPGKVVNKGQFVVLVMELGKLPPLPKGLPVPPATPTTYTVYVGLKQWKKVAEPIKDREDVLIIEGVPKIDAEAGTIAVFATNVSTKNLQRAQREARQAKE